LSFKATTELKMKKAVSFNPCMLNEQGLNLQAVFNIKELPEEIIKQLEAECSTLKNCQQLILIGHGGQSLWQSVQPNLLTSANPIDEHSVETVNKWFTANYSDNNSKIIYPDKHSVSSQALDLQTLGSLAGWHHTSPFMVGINREWGPWFAYRVALLTDTQFNISQASKSSSPCSTCESKVCIDHCPANACKSGSLNLETCISYRKSENSQCRETCLARVSCPVASEHRYSKEQIKYHYAVSMKTIEAYNY